MSDQAPAISSSPSSSSPNAPSSPNTSAAPSSNAGTIKAHTEATKSPTPTSQTSEPELREYKINGKMVKISQREADDYVSKSYAADQRLREAAQLRKEFEAREQGYQKDPLKAFIDYAKKANIPSDQIRATLENYYSKEYIEPETLSREELELRQREAKVKQWEQDQQVRQQEEKRQYETRMTQEQANHITNEILSALENSPLPVTDKTKKYLVQRMAFYMNENNRNNYDAPKEVILRQVVQEHQGLVGDFLADAPVDKILSYMGERGQPFIDRVMKYSLDKLRASRGKKEEPFIEDMIKSGDKNSGKIDFREVNKRLRDIRSGKFI